MALLDAPLRSTLARPIPLDLLNRGVTEERDIQLRCCLGRPFEHEKRSHGLRHQDLHDLGFPLRTLTNSAAGDASGSVDLPVTKAAAHVGCSGWYGVFDTHFRLGDLSVLIFSDAAFAFLAARHRRSRAASSAGSVTGTNSNS